MTWAAYLYDTTTGLLDQQIDIPSFTWSMTISDSALATAQGKGTGEDDISGLELPWSQIPGTTPAARATALQPYKRGIALLWRTPTDDPESIGTPIIAGPLGARTSSQHDVSIPVTSMMGLLEDRYLVHENAFGKDPGHTSRRTYRWENLSWRALACEVIRQCTSEKPGGGLPIDLPYLGESGTHSLPPDGASDDETATSKTKGRKRVATSDGWVETVTDGDTVTVTEQHVSKQTKRITETKPYSYKTKKNGVVTKQHTTTRTITTAQTTVTKKTVTKNHKDYAERSVTTTTVVYAFDADGKQTGSTTSTDGPHKTTIPRQTIAEYKDCNVASHRCSDILTSIANASGGPDMQFRPYLASDQQHIRFRFEAGSDGDIHLHQSTRLSLSCSPYGGTLENVRIDRAAPLMRVYATGAGTDAIRLRLEDVGAARLRLGGRTGGELPTARPILRRDQRERLRRRWQTDAPTRKLLARRNGRHRDRRVPRLARRRVSDAPDADGRRRDRQDQRQIRPDPRPDNLTEGETWRSTSSYGRRRRHCR